MDENKNVTLNEMMDRTPRTGGVSIDLTQAHKTEIDNANNKPKVQANVVQAGPIDQETMTPIDVDSILPRREPKQNAQEAEMMAALDLAVNKEMKNITERIEAIADIQQKEYEEQMENESIREEDYNNYSDESDSMSEDDDTFYEEHYDTRGSNISHVSTSVDSDNAYKTDSENEKPVKENEFPDMLDELDDDDLFDDDNDAEDNKVDSMLEELKSEVKEKLTPIRNALDLSKFTISIKSANAQKVMKMAVRGNQNIADWILYSAKRPISMTALSGPEILKLNPENSGRNRLNTFRDMYRIIYNHVYDANKPEFETWLKQTRFVDLQHIYFALYRATFNGSNFVTYTCPKCNKVFIKDISFESMVEYADEETKERVRNILRMDSTTKNNDSYDSDLVQISDNYVFALKTPSIWNVIIETASLSDKFLEKYSDLIDVVSYIEKIFYIDTTNYQLIPVDTRPDKNDQAKSSARRIKAFYDIIRTLSSEDYYRLRAEIAEYDEGASKVTYQIPACNCPECGEEIPTNKDITPDNMLFTRHQLAAIGNM